MRYVKYSDAHVLTGDAIAEAVMDYAAELAHNGTAETVTVPARTEDGGALRVSFLVGPASEIVLEDAVDVPGPELVDDAVVADIRERIAGLRAPLPTTTSLEDLVAPGDEEV